METATSTQRPSSSATRAKTPTQAANGASPQTPGRNKKENRKVYEILADQVRERFGFKSGTSVKMICRTVNNAISTGKSTFETTKEGKKYVLLRLEPTTHPKQIGTLISDHSQLRSGPARGASPLRLYLS